MVPPLTQSERPPSVVASTMPPEWLVEGAVVEFYSTSANKWLRALVVSPTTDQRGKAELDIKSHAAYDKLRPVDASGAAAAAASSKERPSAMKGASLGVAAALATAPSGPSSPAAAAAAASVQVEADMLQPLDASGAAAAAAPCKEGPSAMKGASLGVVAGAAASAAFACSRFFGACREFRAQGPLRCVSPSSCGSSAWPAPFCWLKSFPFASHG